jgi:acetylornithine aminotransferase
MGSMIKTAIEKLPGVREVRGRGLLLGIVLDNSIAKELVSDLAVEGVLANATSEGVIRIAPPLIVGRREVTIFVKTFSKVMNQRLSLL